MSSETRVAALAALAYGMINERDGYRYYNVVADHVRDIKGQAMFRGLARDEVKHYQILAAQYLSVRENRGWLPLSEAESADVPAIDDFEIDARDVSQSAIPDERLFPDPSVVVADLDQGTGDLQAIDLALEAEQRGYNMYREAHDRATDANAKAAYRVLMDEERRHYEWLRQSRRYLDNNDTYWDDTELPFFTG